MFFFCCFDFQPFLHNTSNGNPIWSVGIKVWRHMSSLCSSFSRRQVLQPCHIVLMYDWWFMTSPSPKTNYICSSFIINQQKKKTYEALHAPVKVLHAVSLLLACQALRRRIYLRLVCAAQRGPGLRSLTFLCFVADLLMLRNMIKQLSRVTWHRHKLDSIIDRA